MNGHTSRFSRKIALPILAGLFSAATTLAGPTTLLPVPAMDTEGMEPAIREEIETDRKSGDCQSAL